MNFKTSKRKVWGSLKGRFEQAQALKHAKLPDPLVTDLVSFSRRLERTLRFDVLRTSPTSSQILLLPCMTFGRHHHHYHYKVGFNWDCFSLCKSWTNLHLYIYRNDIFFTLP